MVLPFDGSLSQLQWFVQSHLPAVYDDSLSYYELLSKVISQLNTNTDFTNGVNTTLTNLITEYNTLKNQPTTSIGQTAKFADIDSKFAVLGEYVLGLANDGTTDVTKTLKNAIEGATGKHLYIPNGTYLISDSIKIPSNVHLSFGSNCVIKAKDGMNIPFFINDYTAGISNIFIQGGTFDGNGSKQAGNTCIFQLKNVNGLVIRDVTLKNTYGLATNFANINNFLFENIHCDQDNLSPNQDGIHVCGPAKNGVIRNVYGATWDDMVALNADDGAGAFSTGAITNIVVDGVQSENGYRAVRLLSTTSLMDRITVKNINYNASQEIIQAGNNGLANGKGNFGKIAIENVQGVGQNGSILINGSFDELDIKKVVRNDGTNAPTLNFQDTYSINTLRLSEFTSRETVVNNGSTTMILDGYIGTLYLNKIKVVKSNVLQRAFLIRNHVDELFATDVHVSGGNNVFEITDADTVIGEIFLNNVKGKGMATYLFYSEVAIPLLTVSNIKVDGGTTPFRMVGNSATCRLKVHGLEVKNSTNGGRGSGKKDFDYSTTVGMSMDGDVGIVDLPSNPQLFDSFIFQGANATLHQGIVQWNGTKFVNLADGTTN